MRAEDANSIGGRGCWLVLGGFRIVLKGVFVVLGVLGTFGVFWWCWRRFNWCLGCFEGVVVGVFGVLGRFMECLGRLGVLGTFGGITIHIRCPMKY